MYEFLEGKITEITPDHVVVNVNGVGYYLHISLHTYELFQSKPINTFFVYLAVKEDSLTFYGFYDKNERALFKLLISVSGIGTNTARLMLSSLTPKQLIGAIGTENVATIKAIKGIGPKTAQRVILDLKDKVLSLASDGEIMLGSGNKTSNEALSALLALGFNKMSVQKTLGKILESHPNAGVEETIKLALKQL